MFVLSTLEDNIAVQPSELNVPTVEAITKVIEKNYFDKVIHDVGLVVTLYDIQHIEGGYVYPLEGAARFRVKFRLVVFRPFVGEVLVGKLAKSDRKGLSVSLGFFNDILVPEYELPEPSMFDLKENTWLWKYEGTDMFFDVGDDIRVRVTRVLFNPLPPPPELQHGVAEEQKVGTGGNPYIPMEVEATTNEEGLGITMWWAQDDEEEEAA